MKGLVPEDVEFEYKIKLNQSFFCFYAERKIVVCYSSISIFLIICLIEDLTL